MASYHTYPRVFTSCPLSEGLSIEAEENIAHYLKNVLRLYDGGAVRLFNGADGEFVGRIERIGRKSAHFTIENRTRPQPASVRRIHLYFAPLKKERMDFLIEKSVELGATDFHPVLTQHGDVRKMNAERVSLQIREAVEQCERLDLPVFHSLSAMGEALGNAGNTHPLYAALERQAEGVHLRNMVMDKMAECSVLVGPPGGFSTEEKARLLNMEGVMPVSLGTNILRSETAALAALAVLAAD